jgi:hypothetical protein
VRSPISRPDCGCSRPSKPDLSDRTPPPSPPAPYLGPNLDQRTSADFRGDVSIELTRRSRPIAAHERIDKNGGGFVHDFFVFTSTDLISVGNVELEAQVYQHGHGSNRKPPNERVLRIWPDSSADSFITTPGNTLSLGRNFYGNSKEAEIAWYDESDDGPVAEFLFARLTVDQTGSFAGTINVRGPSGRVSLPFKFALPGNEKDLALLVGEQTYRLELSFDQSAGHVPEPAASVLVGVGALTLRRRKAP